MCDFEDIDLNQVRAERRTDNKQKWIEPVVYTGKSMEELGEDVPEAGEDVWFT